jgi:uncharacterized protein (DUF58 family)
MLTRRGWAALAGGIVAYGVAVGFGAVALVPLVLALVLGPLGAVAILRRHRHAHLRLTLAFAPPRPQEGVPFTGTAEVEGAAPSSGRLQLRIGASDVTAPLHRTGDGVQTGVIDVPALPRGVHPVRNGELALGDPFGFVRADRALAGAATVIVWPAWVEPESAVGSAAGDGELGRAARRAQPVGYDLHGIREHQEGESLRRVDWKTSARTGRLMVREMDDAARAELTLVVDLDRALLGGERDRVDAMMRVAATLVRGVADSGQKATLVLAGATTQRIALDGGSGSWFAAMDALAGAQADRDAPLAEVVLRDRSLLAGAALTLLTASTSPALAALLDRESAYVPVRVVRTTAAADGAWDALAGTNVEVAALGAAAAAPTEALA